jgi:hypothetical protein
LKSTAPNLPEDFLSIWSNRLPPNIQTILAGQVEGSQDTASQQANRIAEVASLPTTASITQAPDAVALLQQRICPANSFPHQ